MTDGKPITSPSPMQPHQQSEGPPTLRRFLRTWFWLRLCRFAFRRLKQVTPYMPVGIPGIRDPLSPCDVYAPRKRRSLDFACWSDGHYLCRECAHYVATSTEDATLEKE